jgi:hypothetical protein
MQNNREYLLLAMLRYAGYSAKLSSGELNALINKFNINIKASPDLLAQQVNKLINNEEFNNHLNMLHENRNTPKPAALRPVPQFTPKSPEEDLEKTYAYSLRFAPKRPTPFGTQ